MDDLEARLRATVRQHADELAPGPDLTDRIHARVAKRRRQRRVAAGAVTTAAVALAAVGLAAIVGGTGGEDTVAVGGDRPTTTESAPDPTTTATTEPPPTSEPGAPTTGTTDTTTTSGSAEPPPTSGEPPDTPPDGTPLTTSTTSPPADLKPPDSEQPAAGLCGQAGGTVVEVVINPDVPSPRCVRVTADQRLQVRNAAGQTVTVSLADFSAQLAPDTAQVYDRPFGDYLEPGVHRVTVSLYGGSGPEIWLSP